MRKSAKADLRRVALRNSPQFTERHLLAACPDKIPKACVPTTPLTRGRF